MIKILEGQVKDVERQANELIAKGGRALGPAACIGVHELTGARLVMMTLAVVEVDEKEPDWVRMQYELNQAGCCDG